MRFRSLNEEEVIERVITSSRGKEYIIGLRNAIKEGKRERQEEFLEKIRQLFNPDYSTRISLRTSLGTEISSLGNIVTDLFYDEPIEDMQVFLRITIAPKTQEPISVPVLFLGLAGAGKTSISHAILEGYLGQTKPTIGLNSAVFDYKKMRISVLDVGGHILFRSIWKELLDEAETKVIVYVVDSADEMSFLESKKALEKHVLQTTQAQLNPIILVANKQDLPQAISPDKISEMFSESLMRTKWKVIGTSAVTGTGLIKLLESINSFFEMYAIKNNSTISEED